METARDLGALGATISGAGPTVLVWTRAADTHAVAGRLEPLADGWAKVIQAPFATAGAVVIEQGD